MSNVVLYGAYGYTGQLIAAELLKIGIRPLLSGRNEKKLAGMARETGLPYRAVALENVQELQELLTSAVMVVHAAGPFSSTAKPMLQACLATHTHYIDITGEYHVYEYARTLDQQAREAGIMLLPGAGFDVVPSDCLAGHLKQLLPDATSLTLAFTSKGSYTSRGTAKTMIEGAPEGQMYRSAHELRRKPLGSSIRKIDFGDFEQQCVGISWGDISTAYASTGIPNIEVFTGAPDKQIKKMQRMGRFSFLLRWSFIQKFLKKQVDKRPAGPGEERRKKAQSWFWGEVSDGIVTVEARLKTPDGYTLTAMTAADITQHILDGNFKKGFQTPALAYGPDFINKVPGVSSFF